MSNQHYDVGFTIWTSMNEIAHKSVVQKEKFLSYGILKFFIFAESVKTESVSADVGKVS